MYISFREISKQINNSKEVILRDANILSYGSNRICYLDETNPSKLIKIARHPENWKKDHRQSFSEWYVTKSIAPVNTDCRISLCQSWVRTNKGPGLVVDRIVDDHGQSITLRKLLFKRELTVNRALFLIENIIYNFSIAGIPASDFNLKSNIILQSKVLSSCYTKRKWRQTKPRFTYCAQKVYAGDYCFAAAVPLSDASSGTSGIKK